MLSLESSLRRIHEVYYENYDKLAVGTKGGRVAELRPNSLKKPGLGDLERIPDAAVIMTDIKSRVLRGVNMTFSGIIPLGHSANMHDLGVWAKTFGATVDVLSKKTTHLVASPDRRTHKVGQAIKLGRAAIVSQWWLYACFSEWKRVDETPYLIHSGTAKVDGNALPSSLQSTIDGQPEKGLSSSEDGATTDEEPDLPSGTDTPNGHTDDATDVTVDTETEELAELEKYRPAETASPTLPTGGEDWDEVNAELAEFLGSEADDDSDAESLASERDLRPAKELKRKRDDADSDRDTASDSAGEDPDLSGGGIAGSRLQKRKREALARTTSLTNMSASVSSPPGASSGPTSGTAVIDTAAETGTDDELEAALAAEMERQSEEDGE